MKAGATYNLIVKLPEITDEPSEQEIIDEVIFTIKCGSVQLSKVYPSDVSLNGDIYIIPLNQSETKQLVGNCQLEAQINYTNKAVQKSYIQSFTVSDTLATKDVEGVPDAVHNSELILKLIGSDVLVISIVPEVADKIIKNMNELYLSTKQAMEDTKLYGEQTKSDLQVKLQDALNSIDAITAGKLQDIANTTVEQLKNINNTAVAQIEAINSTAVRQIEAINNTAKKNIESETNSIVQAAQGQITGINNVASGQISAINNVANRQISAINSTAVRQISAINSTAVSQINAINSTAQAQAQAIELQANEIYSNLGILPGTATLKTRGPGDYESRPYSIPRTGKYIRLDSMIINGSEVELNETNYLLVMLSLWSDGTGNNVPFKITEIGKNYSIEGYSFDEYKYICLIPHYSSAGLDCTIKYTLIDYDVRAELDDLKARVTALENKKEV